jgi:hypothetical protein
MKRQKTAAAPSTGQPLLGYAAHLLRWYTVDVVGPLGIDPGLTRMRPSFEFHPRNCLKQCARDPRHPLPGKRQRHARLLHQATNPHMVAAMGKLKQK